MDYTQWKDLLGLKADDPKIKAAVAKAGVTLPLKVAKDETDVRADLKDKGTTLVFTDEAFLRGLKDRRLGEGPPIFAEIVLILQHPKAATYQGALPFELKKESSQTALRSRFGQPLASDEPNRWDRWRVGELLLTALYAKDLQSLNRIVVGLPVAE